MNVDSVDAPVPVDDASPAGFLLTASQDYELGATQRFKLILPRGQQQEFAGRVVRKNYQEPGVGVSLVDPSGSVKDVLVALMVQHYSAKDLTEVATRHPSLRSDHLVSRRNHEAVKEHLARVCSEERSISLASSRDAGCSIGTLTSGHWGFGELVEITLESDIRLRTGDSILATCGLDEHSFSFEGVILCVDVERRRLGLTFPNLLFFAERRRLQRATSSLGHRITIRRPSSSDSCFVGYLKDSHTDGLAFVLDDPRSLGLASRGTRLPDVCIAGKDRPVWRGSAEICHITEREEELVVGVQTNLTRRGFRNVEPQLLRMTLPVERRVPTATSAVEAVAASVEIITFPNPDGHEIVGVLNRAGDAFDSPVPVVIVPPAWGKTKETLFALALTLTETFRAHHEPVVVLRYDGVNRRGESYHSPGCEHPENHALRATIDQGSKDMAGAIEYAQNNPDFVAGPIFLVTFSLASLEARKLLRDAEMASAIDHWVVCVGAPEVRDIMRRIGANYDIVEAVSIGQEIGTIEFLGLKADMGRFVRDAISGGLDGLARARKDFAEFPFPITWLSGAHDHWVDPAHVHDVMSVEANASRHLLSLGIGHNARTSDEAMTMFSVVTQAVRQHLQLDEEVVLPSQEEVNQMKLSERERLPVVDHGERSDYWEGYLLSDGADLGFDVLNYSSHYQSFLDRHWELLDLEGSEHVVEFGAGTGNLATRLLERSVLPRILEITELVPAALDEARAKHSRAGLIDLLTCRYNVASLELNRYNVIRSFLAGELHSVMALHGQIEGLSYKAIQAIDERMDPWLYGILRGAAVGEDALKRLRRGLDWSAVEVVLDINQAARAVRTGRAPGRSYRRLVFTEDLATATRLPYATNAVDGVVGSLVIPYLFNVGPSFEEMFRILRPGGTLVMSTMRPDADTSGIYRELIDELEGMEDNELPDGHDRELLLRSARRFLSDAAGLVDLEEEGVFEFYTEAKLERFCRDAGFNDVRIFDSFWVPPQAQLVRARKPDD